MANTNSEAHLSKLAEIVDRHSRPVWRLAAAFRCCQAGTRQCVEEVVNKHPARLAQGAWDQIIGCYTNYPYEY